MRLLLTLLVFWCQFGWSMEADPTPDFSTSNLKTIKEKIEELESLTLEIEGDINVLAAALRMADGEHNDNIMLGENNTITIVDANIELDSEEFYSSLKRMREQFKSSREAHERCLKALEKLKIKRDRQ